MKKVKGLFLAALAAAAMFTSCSDDNAAGPEIKFVNYDGAAMSINKGDTVKFTYQAVAGDAKIATTVVTYAFGSNDDALASSTTKELDNGFEVTVAQKLSEVGVYTFTIYAADKDDKVDSATVVVTVKDAAVALGAGSTITLGASGNTANGSYYSVDSKTVYKTEDAKTNVAKVSFVYNYDATAKASIYSATESTALKTLAGVTETKFILATGVTFATATDADLAKFTPNAIKLTGLAKGDVIAYKTAAGKTGFILVEALVEAADGTATLVVKMK